MITVNNLFYQGFGRLRIRNFLSEEAVQNRAAGVFNLQFILQFQRFKNITGIVYRQMRGIRVIRVGAIFHRLVVSDNNVG